jgi:pyranose oxidase
VDVLIIGSGPIGATFARQLVKPGRTVYMIDAGAQQSARYGEHLKNSFLFQRNVDLFVSVIRGHLSTVSVPPRDDPALTLDPSAFQYDPNKYKGFIKNGQNPNQDRHENLDSAAVTYAVGGMATHWTCATPRFVENVELSWGGQEYPIETTDLNKLYDEAEEIIGTTSVAFDESIRHQLVRRALHKNNFPEVKSLPLAVKRREDKKELVIWSGTDTVLGPLLADPGYMTKSTKDRDGEFRLFQQHQCTELVFSDDYKGKVKYARVWNLKDWNEEFHITAKIYVVACNALLTPQLLFASGLTDTKLPALGHYLTEQPMSFCQVVLHQNLIDELINNKTPDDYISEDMIKRIEEYRKDHTNDPVPIPINEPDPNLWIQVSKNNYWHCQIHRDAFSYGDVAPDVDSRLIVDFRWFGICRPNKENSVTFSAEVRDSFGMPQPTFRFNLSPKDRDNAGEMIAHMTSVAAELGGYLPGSEPQFLKPGLPLHFAGTTRMGLDPETSVVDVNSKVHNVENLYLGGNGLHPFGNGGNPTLTSMAMALKSAKYINDTKQLD